MSAGEDGESVSGKTFVEYGLERLRALCVGVGASALSADCCRLFETALHPWGHVHIGHRPRYRSAIADDEAPFELSVGLSQGLPEVQFYVEAQGEPPGLEANMTAGRQLLDRLARRANASMQRFRAIEDLFLPSQPQGDFTIWTGASWVLGHDVRLKVYLNPQVRGKHAAPRVLEEAMARLGFERPWAKVQSQLALDRAHEVSILSLDLSDEADARVKVYIRHYVGGLASIHQQASMARDYVADDVTLFYDVMTAGRNVFDRKPPITELAFSATWAEGPASVTLEFPIGKYAANDEIASRRIGDCLGGFGLHRASYDQLVRAFATLPPDRTRGIQAHVTLRRVAGQARVAVYFASGAYPARSDELAEQS